MDRGMDRELPVPRRYSEVKLVQRGAHCKPSVVISEHNLERRARNLITYLPESYSSVQS
jgi:hypothetical protein